jgi:hypothetical protein
MKVSENKLLRARISALEKTVQFLLRLNGMDLSELRNASDGDLHEHYIDAVRTLKGDHPKMEKATYWADLFVKISEYELLRLRDITGYPHTWEPFYLLCVKYMTFVRKHPRLGKEPPLLRLYALLEKGRASLRDSAIIMLRLSEDKLGPRTRILIKDDELARILKCEDRRLIKGRRQL